MTQGSNGTSPTSSTPTASESIAYPLYSVPESARYLKAVDSPAHGVQARTLVRWIHRGVTSPRLVGLPRRGMLIEFADLISMRMVTAMRSAKVKWSEIDATAAWLRKRVESDYPLATEHIWTGQGDLFIQWRGQLISGSRHGQAALGLIQEYLFPVANLVFSQQTYHAESWEPVSGVTIKPEVQLGVPCIKGTRIPTRSVVDAIEAGDSPDWVGQAYGITAAAVQAACDWESRLATA